MYGDRSPAVEFEKSSRCARDASGGEDCNPDVCPGPALEGGEHIRVDFPFELADRVSLLPDASLERLERSQLSIVVDEEVDERNDVAGRRVAVRRVLQAAEIRDDSLNLQVGGVLLQELGGARTRVRKEPLMHEGDRRGRAFDVEEHDLDACRGQIERFVHSFMSAAVRARQRRRARSKAAGTRDRRRCRYSAASSRTDSGRDEWRGCASPRTDRTSGGYRAAHE